MNNDILVLLATGALILTSITSATGCAQKQEALASEPARAAIVETMPVTPALADAEEADDLYDKEDNGADAGGDPADDRYYRAYYRDQDRNDRDLEPLTDVEHRERRGRRGEERDDDADEAHQIREHREDLVVGNVPRIEFGGVIGGIIRLRLILLLLIGIIGKLTATAPADHGVVVV